MRTTILLEDSPEIDRERYSLQRPVERKEVEGCVGADHAAGLVKGDESFEAGCRSNDAEQLADGHIVVRINRSGDIGALRDLTQARSGVCAQHLDSRARQLRFSVEPTGQLLFRKFAQCRSLMTELLLQPYRGQASDEAEPKDAGREHDRNKAHCDGRRKGQDSGRERQTTRPGPGPG